MKKSLLLLICFYCFHLSTNAQSLIVLSEEGEDISNDTIKVTLEPSDSYLEVVAFIKNISGDSKSVLAKRYDVDLESGSDAYFCWDKCYPSTTMLSETAINVEAGDTIKSFHGDFKPNNISGTSNILYTFFVYKDNVDSVSLCIQYNAGTTTSTENLNLIESTITSYPNPANDVVYFNYEMPKGNGIICLYDLLGRKVKEVLIDNSAKTTKMDVSGLSTGIYIWTFEVEQNTIKSDKLIIR